MIERREKLKRLQLQQTEAIVGRLFSASCGVDVLTSGLSSSLFLASGQDVLNVDEDGGPGQAPSTSGEACLRSFWGKKWLGLESRLETRKQTIVNRDS